MRRILIIDDHPPSFIGELTANARDENNEPPFIEHINPLSFVSGGIQSDEAVANLLKKIETVASQFWDVIVIDLFLGELGLDPRGNREVPLRIVESFREHNKSATVLLYSGTLADYITELLKGGASDTQLRRIFQASISNFVQRSRVAREVVSFTENPSCLLLVDRLLMKYSSLIVRPEEAEFKGRSFFDLAMAVRRQDADGQKITQLASEYGISCFADLNS